MIANRWLLFWALSAYPHLGHSQEVFKAKSAFAWNDLHLALATNDENQAYARSFELLREQSDILWTTLNRELNAKTQSPTPNFDSEDLKHALMDYLNWLFQSSLKIHDVSRDYELLNFFVQQTKKIAASPIATFLNRYQDLELQDYIQSLEKNSLIAFHSQNFQQKKQLLVEQVQNTQSNTPTETLKFMLWASSPTLTRKNLSSAAVVAPENHWLIGLGELTSETSDEFLIYKILDFYKSELEAVSQNHLNHDSQSEWINFLFVIPMIHIASLKHEDPKFKEVSMRAAEILNNFKQQGSSKLIAQNIDSSLKRVYYRSTSLCSKLFLRMNPSS